MTVADKNIYEITNLSIVKLQEFLQNMQLSERQLAIGSQILKEIKARIQFLMDVGLDYLALSVQQRPCRVEKRRESVWQHRLVRDW